jgi:hypothetical protein
MIPERPMLAILGITCCARSSGVGSFGLPPPKSACAGAARPAWSPALAASAANRLRPACVLKCVWWQNWCFERYVQTRVCAAHAASSMYRWLSACVRGFDHGDMGSVRGAAHVVPLLPAWAAPCMCATLWQASRALAASCCCQTECQRMQTDGGLTRANGLQPLSARAMLDLRPQC